MLRPLRINVGKLLDPVKLQQIAKYQGNLTITSNDTNIIPRDEAGNIQLQEESETNPLLIIEPVATKITLNSVLKVLDTRFEYFKFPVTVTATDETTDLDVDLTIESADTTYARYRPSEARRINLPIGTWSDEAKFSGILMDFVEDGAPQKAVNQYQITKEIKESGIDLRFRIKIEHRFDSDSAIYGTSYFSIIKNSPNTGLNKLFKGPFANQSAINGNWGEIYQYEVQSLNLDLTILNSEFEIGDYLSIGAFAGQNADSAFHTINPVQSYWSITDASKNVDEWNQEIN